MELLLRNSCNGISRQGPDGAGGCRREKRHTLGNGDCLAAFPLVCYFFSKFIGMKKMWGERNEKELCYQGSLKRLELTKSKVYQLRNYSDSLLCKSVLCFSKKVTRYTSDSMLVCI